MLNGSLSFRIETHLNSLSELLIGHEGEKRSLYGVKADMMQNVFDLCGI